MNLDDETPQMSDVDLGKHPGRIIANNSGPGRLNHIHPNTSFFDVFLMLIVCYIRLSKSQKCPAGLGTGSHIVWERAPSVWDRALQV